MAIQSRLMRGGELFGEPGYYALVAMSLNVFSIRRGIEMFLRLVESG